ncbi:MAG TPA: chorismate mutase, partial [Candidatus Nitrosocosmicus sp.]|nr:chorismate mutase [Candidatus Nitrosocosmicus sp.]
MTIEKLDGLRSDMKIVTQNIISLINQRMEIAKKIGEIKSELQLRVVDDKAEQEIKNYVLHNINNKGLDPEFLGRIINMLIKESVSIQNNEKNKMKLLTNNNDNDNNNN